jgi:acyl carrier protein
VTHVGERIRNWIASEILYEDGGRTTLTDDAPLLGGIVDSMGIVSLLVFIQEEFNITIDDVDVTPENFRDLATIERFVTSKLSTGTQAEASLGDR